MEYILDADWVINALAKKRQAAEILKELSSSGIGISIITLGELYEGAFGSPHPQENLETMREFVALFTVIQLTDAIMERFASIRYQLRKAGQIISDFDILLAATALDHGLTMLTFNREHYMRIPTLRLYPTSD